MIRWKWQLMEIMRAFPKQESIVNKRLKYLIVNFWHRSNDLIIMGCIEV